eukprot:767296-Amphidinium_carterae.5
MTNDWAVLPKGNEAIKDVGEPVRKRRADPYITPESTSVHGGGQEWVVLGIQDVRSLLGPSSGAGALLRAGCSLAFCFIQREGTIGVNQAKAAPGKLPWGRGADWVRWEEGIRRRRDQWGLSTWS